MKLFSYIPSFLKNKFLIASIVFTVWILFFDRNDILTQMDRKAELSALKESKGYYTQEIEKERKISEELQSDPSTIEKYAREKYLMKRDNEELFVIQAAENR
jgi:cell division protein FtsB